MDNMIIMTILVGVFLFCLIISFILKRVRSLKNGHVSENSFQRYAKFFGETVPSDSQFDTKLSTIYDLIHRQQIRDINIIAEKSLCTIPETVLKIRYLQNKRLINHLYIDTSHGQLIPCSFEDAKLLDKYKPFIYASHVQIDEMLPVIANPNHLNLKDLRKEVLKELVYLNKKGLLNGIKIDDIDGKITYYTIEKRKVSTDYVTIHCPNWGSLNDVDVNDKKRCEYCGTILYGEK